MADKNKLQESNTPDSLNQWSRAHCVQDPVFALGFSFLA